MSELQTMTGIHESALQTALNTLDVQRNNCMTEKLNGEAAYMIQKAYYQGMKQMLEIMITNGYHDVGAVVFNDFTDTHYIATE